MIKRYSKGASVNILMANFSSKISRSQLDLKSKYLFTFAYGLCGFGYIFQYSRRQKIAVCFI